MAKTAIMLGGKPSSVEMPDDSATIPSKSDVSILKSSSAIGLLQIFPVQTKRIVFTLIFNIRGPEETLCASLLVLRRGNNLYFKSHRSTTG